MINTEHLEDDLVRIISEAGYNLSVAAIKVIYDRAREKTNTSFHKEFSYYHDQETVDFIRDKDSLIIDKYGFKPPAFN